MCVKFFSFKKISFQNTEAKSGGRTGASLLSCLVEKFPRLLSECFGPEKSDPLNGNKESSAQAISGTKVLVNADIPSTLKAYKTLLYLYVVSNNKNYNRQKTNKNNTPVNSKKGSKYIAWIETSLSFSPSSLRDSTSLFSCQQPASFVAHFSEWYNKALCLDNRINHKTVFPELLHVLLLPTSYFLFA